MSAIERTIVGCLGAPAPASGAAVAVTGGESFDGSPAVEPTAVAEDGSVECETGAASVVIVRGAQERRMRRGREVGDSGVRASVRAGEEGQDVKHYLL